MIKALIVRTDAWQVPDMLESAIPSTFANVMQFNYNATFDEDCA